MTTEREARADVCLSACYDNMHDRFFNKPKNASDLSLPRELESNIDSGGQYHSINVTYWTFQPAK